MIPTDIAERLLYVQQIFRDKTLPEKGKSELLFLAQPNTKRGMLIGPAGAPAEEDSKWQKWADWLDTNEGAEYKSFVFNAKYHLPPNVILNKYQMIMDAYQLNIAEVTRLEKRIYGDEYNTCLFSVPACGQWDVIREYMDEFIKLPDVPNVTYRLYSEHPDVPQIDGAYSEERTEKFLRALNEREPDYILQFMLFVMLRPDGDLCEYLDPGDSKYDNMYNYARPSQVREFTRWHHAWNRLVSAICQRFEALCDPATDTPNPPQKACGSLISVPKYRLTAKEYALYQSTYPGGSYEGYAR